MNTVLNWRKVKEKIILCSEINSAIFPCKVFILCRSKAYSVAIVVYSILSITRHDPLRSVDTGDSNGNCIGDNSFMKEAGEAFQLAVCYCFRIDDVQVCVMLIPEHGENKFT